METETSLPRDCAEAPQSLSPLFDPPPPKATHLFVRPQGSVPGSPHVVTVALDIDPPFFGLDKNCYLKFEDVAKGLATANLPVTKGEFTYVVRKLYAWTYGMAPDLLSITDEATGFTVRHTGTHHQTGRVELEYPRNWPSWECGVESSATGLLAVLKSRQATGAHVSYVVAITADVWATEKNRVDRE